MSDSGHSRWNGNIHKRLTTGESRIPDGFEVFRQGHRLYFPVLVAGILWYLSEISSEVHRPEAVAVSQHVIAQRAEAFREGEAPHLMATSEGILSDGGHSLRNDDGSLPQILAVVESPGANGDESVVQLQSADVVFLEGIVSDGSQGSGKSSRAHSFVLIKRLVAYLRHCRVRQVYALQHRAVVEHILGNDGLSVRQSDTPQLRNISKVRFSAQCHIVVTCESHTFHLVAMVERMIAESLEACWQRDGLQIVTIVEGIVAYPRHRRAGKVNALQERAIVEHVTGNVGEAVRQSDTPQLRHISEMPSSNPCHIVVTRESHTFHLVAFLERTIVNRLNRRRQRDGLQAVTIAEGFWADGDKPFRQRKGLDARVIKGSISYAFQCGRQSDGGDERKSVEHPGTNGFPK